MPSYPAAKGLIASFIWASRAEEGITSIPFICPDNLDPEHSCTELFNALLGAPLTEFQDLLSDEMRLNEITVRPMCKGKGFSANHALGGDAALGDYASPALPTNVSVLVACYSSDQIGMPQRTSVGKLFLPPPPEAAVIRNFITDDYATNFVATFVDTLEDIVGGTTGKHYLHAINRSNNPLDSIYVRDTYLVRQYPSTQKRRATHWLG